MLFLWVRLLSCSIDTMLYNKLDYGLVESVMPHIKFVLRNHEVRECSVNQFCVFKPAVTSLRHDYFT